MQAKPWRYKSAYLAVAMFVAVIVVRTMCGIGDWAYDSVFGPDTPRMSVEPTATHDETDYQWPH
ncbi:hypothetical protein MAHJHV58_46320 [Mycobacterium avium subsp. hominissuis]|uniref:hypothetical protein n=1 Tax=Mycobacterium avium TaxID=1764 RepID=UPI00044DE891|nr:hypothetical protein [Mycobacterium avium]ETZ55251.1 hypothetical protein L838_0907 [Mycobacterium avium MAV_120709_2344]MCA4736293.1 hypothetical protein [Mycobacterium avium subsp. hominissuis]MCA4740943.1 hypothetical protein [Mycobacterium avium subsp. hominissuis]MCA4745474.1 hypothetical protein [Mycobacterium avium subsp. hominissuis]MCA4765799.1 hypothetical protein [Mycobacterium avium subsp. hominissuis]